ncbi:hypothetical protein NDU88_003090 [Pleurodeles waltl]|uniref:Uncharacterized protein n=1 Tax=Pleurodeles waltl TaxID=8319 RepID=A0AAV7V0S1_PLEWA|nr:hypothetical protein NDU88_003090 [Pleurodeles waltl]
MEWGGCVELEEGAVGVDQGGEQADTGVGVLSYLNKLQGNSMLFDELYYKNFGDDYISSLKPSLIVLVFEATRNTFSGAANILEADLASEDVMDNYDIPAQEVEVSKDHLDNRGRNVTYRNRLGRMIKKPLHLKDYIVN